MMCSARRCLALLMFGLALADKSHTENCDALGAEKAKLQEQLKHAQVEVSQLRAQLAGAKGTEESCVNKLSIIEAASQVGSIAGGVVGHLLEQTDHDDIVIDKVSGHASAGWAFTVDVAGKIAAVDYKKHAESVKQHPIYVQHVAPAVGKALDMVQPHVDNYLVPAMEKARSYAGPALDVAKGAATTASAEVGNNVVPALRHASKRAASELPKHWETAQGGLARSLDPIFHLAGKASPKHAKALPSHLWDRVAMLLIVLFFAYHFSKFARIVLHFSLRLVYKTVKICFKIVFRWVLLKLLSYFIWFATGFYCCGICRSRTRAKKLTNEPEKNGKASEKSNGAAKGKESNSKPPQKATAEELTQLLETSKKKDKLDPAVKVLVSMAGTGKVMTGKNFPENVQGKLLEKDALKKALGKFKEVDVKKLKL